MDPIRTIADEVTEDWPGLLARVLEMPRADVERELAAAAARIQGEGA